MSSFSVTTTTGQPLVQGQEPQNGKDDWTNDKDGKEHIDQGIFQMKSPINDRINGISIGLIGIARNQEEGMN